MCCCCSVAKSCPTLSEPVDCGTSLSFTISWSLLKLISIESVMPSNHLILCRLLLLLLSIFPCIRVFSFQWISFSHQVAKLLELQLQHQSFQWILRADFLRIDWFDLLAVQGTLKSLLQHHSLKVTIFHCSAFFMVQSHIHTWLLEKLWFWLCRPLLAKWCLCFLLHLKKEFTGPGLHLRPVCADHAWPPLQWTLNSVLSACGNDKGRIRPPSGQGNLEEEKTDTNHPWLRTLSIRM